MSPHDGADAHLPAVRRGYFVGRALADLHASGASSTELVRHSLAAIAELDPVLNAFAAVDQDGATAAAQQADEERASGIDRGPLHGIPVAVKDIVDVASLPATMGSAHLADRVATTDAECVRRLRAAGAVIVGKTTTHQFAFGPTGDRSATGATRNPHDPGRMSGGSSSGSASAVAAGMVPVALGTDTGGSVRIPAALCGVVGFKPAYGTVPTDGVFPVAGSLDTVGVLAGTAADCLHTWRTLAGLPPGPAANAPTPTRIAWLRPFSDVGVDPAVQQVAREALGQVDEVTWPAATETREAFLAVQTYEVAGVHADMMANSPELYDPEVLDRLRGASHTPAARHAWGIEQRDRLRATVLELLDDHQILALPTVPIVAPQLQQREVDILGSTVGTRDALLSLTSPWNLLGLPAVSVPTGTVAGLPVGTQLIARADAAELLLSAADDLRMTQGAA
ncbi:MAG: amidase [Streptosporangiales bacterium]|nr:amidase [Streptosporangiales bacterium]